MSYRPGDIFYKQVTTFSPSGISTNTDVTPWATLVHNGVDDFTPHVFVTNVDVGRYTVSGVIPSTYAVGSSINVAVSGLVTGNLSKAVVDLDVLSAPNSGLFDYVQIEPGLNARQLLALLGAPIGGVSSGAGNTLWYQGANNPAQNRVSSVCTSGIRTVVSYVLP
jgi:hypothetical protein